MPRCWLLIPCTGSRVAELRDTIKLTGIPLDTVVIVTTDPDPVSLADLGGLTGIVLKFDKPGMLFGEWMNLGLDYITEIMALHGEWYYDVACLSSDVQGCDSFAIGSMSTELRARKLSMVGPDLTGIAVAPGDVLVSGPADQRHVYNRIHGSCFMVAGELGLRFDPQFRWWYSDDDLETQARHLGGVGLIGGLGVKHVDNPPSAESQAHAVVDRARYVSKWGREPW